MSWLWVWRSLVDFAESPTASSVFLSLYRQMIMEQGIERILCVTRVDAVAGGFMPGETRVWGEQELSGLVWLQAAKDWEKLRGWVVEMDTLQMEEIL